MTIEEIKYNAFNGGFFFGTVFGIVLTLSMVALILL